MNWPDLTAAQILCLSCRSVKRAAQIRSKSLRQGKVRRARSAQYHSKILYQSQANAGKTQESACLSLFLAHCQQQMLRAHITVAQSSGFLPGALDEPIGLDMITHHFFLLFRRILVSFRKFYTGNGKKELHFLKSVLLYRYVTY